MLRDILAKIFTGGRLKDAETTRVTRHPGSKKNKKRHQQKLRAAQKRAKQSRKRNRRK